MDPLKENTKEEGRANLPKEEIPKRHSSKALLYLYLVVVLGAIGYALWFFLQKPAIGTVKVGTTEKEAGVFDRNQEKKRYEGKYISFSYPGTYEEKSHTLPVKNPVKESIFLSQSNLEGRKISIMVEERPGTSLEESPSFQMRMMEKSIYAPESFSFSGFQGVTFSTDKSIFEQSAYFRHQGYVISITLSSPLSDKGLKEGLLEVIESLRFPEDL